MLEINIQSKERKLSISSEEVKCMIGLRPDFECVQDISDTINQENIIVFDCQLSREVFSLQGMEDVFDEVEEGIDESYFDVLFEDVRAYLKDATDEIEEELQEKYKFDDIRCFFNIYNSDDTFTDFKFVFLVSFKKIKISDLTNLSNIVGTRQLVGKSKFYC